ncbi:MAG: hypothetical protein WAV21_02100 [Minisyncoccia bacterium]
MKEKAGDFLLRAGLALSFLYPPVAAWSDPFTWLGYIPSWTLDLWPFTDVSLLHLFGALEIILALWILSGRKIAVPSIICGLILVFIVATNPSQFEVLFRDLSIAALAFALAATHCQKKIVM